MTETANAGAAAPREPSASLVSYVQWMYALHALSAAIGILGSAMIITAFVFGLPSIVAVVMNYVRRDEARGTWLESHFAWQLRTFWLALLWLVVLAVIGALFALTIIGLPLAFLFFLGLIGVGIWAVYRIARGWLKLREGVAP
ncbi:MAG TPA: hypothetical protein VLB69_14385 [Rudaea sp.]|nr:hypothetical protein [Rudaea sp.]